MIQVKSKKMKRTKWAVTGRTRKRGQKVFPTITLSWAPLPLKKESG